MVEVHGYAVAINTVQPTVQGVLSGQQIESLPVNGRNFLELAPTEPGVQIQDAAGFGFGFKDKFSSISFGGRFGRTTRRLGFDRAHRRRILFSWAAWQRMSP